MSRHFAWRFSYKFFFQSFMSTLWSEPIEHLEYMCLAFTKFHGDDRVYKCKLHVAFWKYDVHRSLQSQWGVLETIQQAFKTKSVVVRHKRRFFCAPLWPSPLAYIPYWPPVPKTTSHSLTSRVICWYATSFMSLGSSIHPMANNGVKSWEPCLSFVRKPFIKPKWSCQGPKRPWPALNVFPVYWFHSHYDMLEMRQSEPGGFPTSLFSLVLYGSGSNCSKEVVPQAVELDEHFIKLVAVHRICAGVINIPR